MRQLTQAEVEHAFGDPTTFMRPDGTISAAWEAHILTYAQLPAPLVLAWNHAVSLRQFHAHRLIAGILSAALLEVFRSGAWSTIGDFGGCYSWRPMRTNRRRLSMHSWGIAIDLDVGDNPQGGAPKVDQRVIGIMAKAGFLWGGTFHGAAVDGMHFEASDVTLGMIGRAS